ncbi:hypothetical protein HYT33_04280 [Candidatus Roizmanbacteria bacterium]|nr:hypothetical protein [Candidatus Roizmanbacteria bacterium]
MKKTRINLLAGRQNYARIEKYFAWIRWATIGYAAFLLIASGIFSFFLFQQNTQIQSSLEEKRLYLTELGGKKENEAKLIYLAKKMGAYDRFIRDDARFVPYFTLLTETLKSTTESALLSSFVLDKTRTVEFTLSFDDVEAMLESFKFIESPQFLKNFEELSLSQFTSQGEKQKKYALTFEGKFINLDAEKN